MTDRSISPGDLLAFSGIIGLDRGACLVVQVSPIPQIMYLYDVTVLTRHMTLYTVMCATVDNDQTWSKLNDD